jgi:mannose-1-phosphate guanylyltransferase/mannose-6-phosphate isomerase
MRVVILAGGRGTRLWPISRGSFPKQFLKIGDNDSFLQKTVKRFLRQYPPSQFLIVTNRDYLHLVKTQLAQIDPKLEEQILIEPCSRNTGPAILLAVKAILEAGGSSEESVLISSSDYVMSPEEVFFESLDLAKTLTLQGKLVIFGITPNKPETGYGYIKVRERQKPFSGVDRFVEKPSLELAQQYVNAGDYLWNSGILAFQIAHFLDEFKEQSPELWQHYVGDLKKHFSDMPNVSIDYALLEKSQKLAVIPLDLSWSDVGSWDSVFDILEKDLNHNVKIGNVVDIDTKNSLIIGGKRLISTVGLEDVVVIETEDAVFLGKKGESQKVKALVEELIKQGKKESVEHLTIYRPWGSYTVLEEGARYKVKRIVVEPMQTLSLQMHYHRSEHWIVVRGTAKVTIGEMEQVIHENQSMYVPKSTLHRLQNPGKVLLELIEVQVGEYVGEDDIVRFEDVYGRVESNIAEVNQ